MEAVGICLLRVSSKYGFRQDGMPIRASYWAGSYSLTNQHRLAEVMNMRCCVFKPHPDPGHLCYALIAPMRFLWSLKSRSKPQVYENNPQFKHVGKILNYSTGKSELVFVTSAWLVKNGQITEGYSDAQDSRVDAEGVRSTAEQAEAGQRRYEQWK